MAILKSDALVLRTIEYSETSLIVWLFARDFGRVHVIAKGARRARSPFEGALEPLVRGELVFYRGKKAGALDIAKEFDPRDLHLGLRRSLPRLYRALYATELLSELSEQDLPAPAAFDAACALLDACCRGEAGALDVALFRTELALLASAGLAPALDRCASCGAAGELAAFSPSAGGALCPDDAGRERDAQPVAPGALKTLGALASGRQVGVGREVARAIRGLLDGFLRHHLGKELRLARRVRATLGSSEGRSPTSARRPAISSGRRDG